MNCCQDGIDLLDYTRSMDTAIDSVLRETLQNVGITDGIEEHLNHPINPLHGEITSSLPMRVFNAFNKKDPILYPSPLAVAKVLKDKLTARLSKDILLQIDKIEVAKPGYINFFFSNAYLGSQLEDLLLNKKITVIPKAKRRFFIEYAHPNTHKEMHIGHLRTLITGEAIARLLTVCGQEVFRANYQGDIGPHVAKALYGLQRIMEEEHIDVDTLAKESSRKKAHLLGKAYVRGNKDYERHKDQIDLINTKLYLQDGSIWRLYQTTRKWSLDYYDEFYQRFYTTFDRMFFESEMAACGKEIVEKHIGSVFQEDDGAIIFPGDKYGLHRRVFITKSGNPTYEGKEMCNAEMEYEAFPFDKKVHVVASEQRGYFEVVFKALELIDPEKFKDKQSHIPMGMVQFSDRKMSSRTGDVVTADWLIDQVKDRVKQLITKDRLGGALYEKVCEQVTISAIKYSVLKVDTKRDVEFSIDTSVSLDGDSGPYLQYAFVRTKSILERAHKPRGDVQIPANISSEEKLLLRHIGQFRSVVEHAGDSFSPSSLCTYLFDLAQLFNLFYQKEKVLESETESFRLALTAGVSKILQEGLDMLGIEVPEQM